MAGWSAQIDVVVLYEKFGIYVTKDLLVCLDNPFHFHIDEEIVGVDMLLDEAFDLQKGW